MELRALRKLTQGLATLSQLEEKHPVLGAKLADFVTIIRDCCQQAYTRFSACLDSVVMLPLNPSEEQKTHVLDILNSAPNSKWFRDVANICSQLEALANQTDAAINQQIAYSYKHGLEGLSSLHDILGVLRRHEGDLKEDIKVKNDQIFKLLYKNSVAEARDAARRAKAEIEKSLTEIFVISTWILGTRKQGVEEFFKAAGVGRYGNGIESQKSTVVVLVHGIRTTAAWQQRVRVMLTERFGYTVLNLKYGYFDLLRFWCPLGICRRGPIDYLAKQLRNIREDYRDSRMVVFAHSYGTYAVTKVLQEDGRLEIDRLILCGSVVPTSLDLDRIRLEQITHSGDKDEGIVNEVGIRDIWPVLAQSMTWGYGATGTYGFGQASVRDRYHPCRHSDFFAEKFINDYWLPAAAGLKLDFTPTERSADTSPGWFQPLRLPVFKYVVALGLILLFGFVGRELVYVAIY
jgi:pimeloyl-ACP methyl ester carboxylesterase